MQRQQARDGLGIFFRRAAGIVLAGINRHNHRLVIDHHRGGARLGRFGALPASGIDGGDGIGKIERLSDLQRAGIEILAHGGHHGIGVLGRDADIFQHAGQGIAGIQSHGAAFHAWVGIGVVGIVGGLLRLAGPDQLGEQGIGQEGTSRRHHGTVHRHHAHRHPGDGARHQGGEGGGHHGPAPIGGGQSGAGGVQAATQGSQRRCNAVIGIQSGSILRTVPASSPPTLRLFVPAHFFKRDRPLAHPRRAVIAI